MGNQKVVSGMGFRSAGVRRLVAISQVRKMPALLIGTAGCRAKKLKGAP